MTKFDKWTFGVGVAASLLGVAIGMVAFKSPAFKAAFKRRRCLVPANGFYEWKSGTAPRGPKQPYHLTLKPGGLMAFAGIWERWTSPQGETIESFAIITTEANATIKPIHDRMPVIVPPEHYARWLGVTRDPAYVLTLIEPTPATALRAVAVGTLVNHTDRDAPDCIAPIDLPMPR